MGSSRVPADSLAKLEGIRLTIARRDIAVSVGVRELGELSGRDDTDVSHV